MLPPEKDDTPAAWEKPPKPIGQADAGKKRTAKSDETTAPETPAAAETPEQKPKRRKTARKRAESAPERADGAGGGGRSGADGEADE